MYKKVLVYIFRHIFLKSHFLQSFPDILWKFNSKVLEKSQVRTFEKGVKTVQLQF